MSSPPLAVSTGDPGGVGPEVALRAAAAHGDDRVLLHGDAARLQAMARELGIAVGVADDETSPQRITLVDCGTPWSEQARSHRPTTAGGAAQLAALEAAVASVVGGRARALVTAPMSKEAVVLGGCDFSGHTEHLARAAGLAADDVTMMFLGPRLRVALVTTHAPVARLPSLVTPRRVARTCTHLAQALRALHPPQSSPLRIAVAGLNPHAGEAGLFGREEIDAITPGMERSRVGDGVRLEGPIGAETAMRLASSGEVAGVVAMAHDQATIASKLLDWGRAVNVTWGLPYVRTSVDHGVAYDAAAAGKVDSDGMLAALRLAAQLSPR